MTQYLHQPEHSCYVAIKETFVELVDLSKKELRYIALRPGLIRVIQALHEPSDKLSFLAAKLEVVQHKIERHKAA